MTEEQWDVLLHCYEEKQDILYASIKNIEELTQYIGENDHEKVEEGMKIREELIQALKKLQNKLDAEMNQMEVETQSYLNQVLLGRLDETENETILYEAFQNMHEIFSATVQLETKLARDLRMYEESKPKVFLELTEKEIVDIHVLLRKKYNILKELQEISKQMAKHMDAKNQVALARSLEEREIPLQKLQGIQESIITKLGSFRVKDYKRLKQIIEKGETETKREEALAMQARDNRQLMDEVKEFDTRVNARLARG